MLTDLHGSPLYPISATRIFALRVRGVVLPKHNRKEIQNGTYEIPLGGIRHGTES